jgi:peptide-methionine (S)-S-oxide reductase
MRLFITLLGFACAAGSAQTNPFPDPAGDAKASGKQKAVFAGGCFWCTEAVFENVKGVTSVVSGYAGGDAKSAKYDLVSSGATAHAEAIEITYDAGVISYGQLLKIFFSVAHDPTQLNYQGPDYGKQYRSAIFAADAAQKKMAADYVQQLNDAKVFKKPIVTQINDLTKFYAAEAYHQDFVRNNPTHGYVVVNALPKIEKLKKQYPAWLKK